MRIVSMTKRMPAAGFGPKQAAATGMKIRPAPKPENPRTSAAASAARAAT